MKWPMWVAHVDGYVHKVGKTKDDLIGWLLDGHTMDNVVWGFTRAEAIEEAHERWDHDGYVWGKGWLD